MGGEYVSKRDSFGLLKDRLPAESWSGLQAVSRIRAEWSGPESPGALTVRRSLALWNPFLFRYAIAGYPTRKLRPAIELEALLPGIRKFTADLCRQGNVDDRALGNI